MRLMVRKIRYSITGFSPNKVLQVNLEKTSVNDGHSAAHEYEMKTICWAKSNFFRALPPDVLRSLGTGIAAQLAKPK